ncbi:MAG: cadmium-translocating P-type ATPase [Oscillospiraceae bacterium]|nr:cadmium-translocating P-type ATPase [Oscillospiraceae bacterium]
MSGKQKKKLLRILLAAALTLIAALLPLEGGWRLAAFAIPYLAAGWDVLWDAARNIAHGQLFDEQFLMGIATLGAFAVGEYPEAAGVMIFYQVGELFQSIAVGRSRRSIAALMDIRPDYAVVLREGEALRLSPEEVRAGELILVRPGEKIPLDGEITKGRSSVDAAALTGESLPVDRAEGDQVISGSVNLSGPLEIRVSGSYAESTVARILELVENASEKKARAENFITRFARVYTPCVVAAAALLALVPPLLFQGSWGVWINRALIFLMVSCPCALVVSVPLSFFGGIGGASRQGILIKGAGFMETLAGVKTLVFDKTGTLTQGVFAVEAVHPEAVSEEELLDIAAAAERYSAHPVAESIIQAHGGDIDKSRLGAVEELAGLGLRAELDGRQCFVGNGALMDRVGVVWHECELAGTVVHVAVDGRYMGHIVINDRVKPEAAQALAELKRLGVRSTVMLSGDREQVARAVGERLGLDRVYGGLLPEMKVEKVEALLPEGTLAFVGDGVNDAPVLARADVGIAMGAMGSDAAIESADIVLMDDRLMKLPLAVKISRRTMTIVRQNIALALGVKAVILALGALGYAGMWAAIFGDVGVMVVAVLNAMRAMAVIK